MPSATNNLVEAVVELMRPTLVVNPSDDNAFREFAERLLAEWMSVGEFESRLRTRYPRAAVHARELASELATIWYVYREGHWIPSGPARENRSDA